MNYRWKFGSISCRMETTDNDLMVLIFVQITIQCQLTIPCKQGNQRVIGTWTQGGNSLVQFELHIHISKTAM